MAIRELRGILVYYVRTSRRSSLAIPIVSLSVIARFYDQIKSNSGKWKSAAQVYEHIANNSKRFRVQTILASLTGCDEGVEQFQTKFRPVLRLHSIDAYEQYINNNTKATPKPLKVLAENLMAALKQHEKR